MLLIILVAIIAFGPTKLPMVARHLAKIARYFTQLQQQCRTLWQEQLQYQRLQEHISKAEKADALYKKLQDVDQ